MQLAAVEPDLAAPLVYKRLPGLRWAVLVLLAATLPLDALLFGYHVRLELALPAIALLGLSNVALATDRLRVPVAAIVAFDLVVIAVVLAASGGAGNPFSALFFVYVALAAALLPPAGTFGMAALAGCLFAALFALPSGACCPSHPEHGAFSTHLWGMLVAFVVSAGLVAHFLTRMRRSLDHAAREAARWQKQAEEASRFASLGTLAAGTAHELGTPLSTIAVLAGEIGESGTSDAARAAAEGIGQQVDRCRKVVERMRASVRRAPSAEAIPAADAVRAAVRAWSDAHPGVQVVVSERGEPPAVAIGVEDLGAAVDTLLDNALDATRTGPTPDAPIAVHVGDDDGATVVAVEDAGAGVAAAVRDRAGEPFVTTKEPGKGMGLGLYFVRSIVEQVGGRLEIMARTPHGTRVALRLGRSDA